MTPPDPKPRGASLYFLECLLISVVILILLVLMALMIGITFEWWP